MEKILAEQAKEFVQEVCIATWQMSEKEVKNYCLMIVKQNVIFSQFNKDYLKTAAAYAPLTGLTAEEQKKLLQN